MHYNVGEQHIIMYGEQLFMKSLEQANAILIFYIQENAFKGIAKLETLIFSNSNLNTVPTIFYLYQLKKLGIGLNVNSFSSDPKLTFHIF